MTSITSTNQISTSNDKQLSVTNELMTSDIANNAMSSDIANSTMSSDIANIINKTQISISTVPKSPDPSSNERDVTKVDSNETNVISETLMETVDTVSMDTDSSATADFQVGTMEDNEQIVLDTSSEIASEIAPEDEQIVDVNTNEKQCNPASVQTLPSKNKNIVVSSKHFSIAFSKVKPSVSEKVRLYYSVYQD